MRQVDASQVQAIGLGAAVLGSGGGGDPHLGELMAVQALTESGPIELVELDEVPDEALAVMTGMMGAPTVVVERLPGATGQFEALHALSEYLGQQVTHVSCVEIGGMNSTLPLIAGARTGLPLIDADGMGRAFPELHMVSATLHGITAAPMALADDKGNTVLIESGTNTDVEAEARQVCIEMGASAFIALYPMTGLQARESMIPATLSLAQSTGEALLGAKSQGLEPIEALLQQVGGRRLFTGKVVSVDRRTEAGFARGEFVVDGSDAHAGQELTVNFQNENLLARQDESIVATVPDLIALVHLETGRPITTEEVRYGYRVAVLGIPCHEMWRTPAGLELVGPRAFGYGFDYLPIR